MNLPNVMQIIVTANYYVHIKYSPKDAFLRAIFFTREQYPLSKEDVTEAKKRFGYDFYLEDRDWNYMMGW